MWLSCVQSSLFGVFVAVVLGQTKGFIDLWLQVLLWDLYFSQQPYSLQRCVEKQTLGRRLLSNKYALLVYFGYPSVLTHERIEFYLLYVHDTVLFTVILCLDISSDCDTVWTPGRFCILSQSVVLVCIDKMFFRLIKPNGSGSVVWGDWSEGGRLRRGAVQTGVELCCRFWARNRCFTTFVSQNQHCGEFFNKS